MTEPFTDPDAMHDMPENDAPGDDAASAPRPMAPRARHRLRTGHPPQAIPVRRDDVGGDDDTDASSRSTRQDLDPVFGYILAMALSVGLTPVEANTRYVILWTFMAAMGGVAFLLGSGIRLKVTDPGDLLWGIGFGVFTGGALMLVGADTLSTVAERLFASGETQSPLLNTWIFQATVFVMPMSEALFFRGAMQRAHGIPTVALMASAWSMLMFFPHLGLQEAPVVGVVFTTAFVLLNFLYSYVQWRHGLAASFFCQITAGTLLLLVPRLVVL